MGKNLTVYVYWPFKHENNKHADSQAIHLLL